MVYHTMHTIVDFGDMLVCLCIAIHMQICFLYFLIKEDLIGSRIQERM